MQNQKIIEDTKLDFSNVLIQPKPSVINSRNMVDLERKILSWSGVPIIAANMDTVGTFEIYSVLKEFKMITALHKFYTDSDFKGKDLDPDLFMVSVGINDDELFRLQEINKIINFKWICIDIANGYLYNMVNFCKKVRSVYPDKLIVAGNVATPDMVEELITKAGVDVVKIGIGPGSACTTRLKTGVGYPQLSAIMECSEKAHSLGKYIISDGGISCPGDMSKAFGAGADFVMIGGQFSGHDENPGEVIEIDGKNYKLFYGMSSAKAMNKHYGKVAEYRTSEGRELKVPYKGPLKETVLDYLGGIRSTCTYINASSISEMPEKTTFIRVNQQLNLSLVSK